MKTLLLILSAILFFLQTGKACTIIVAGKKATVDGSVFKFTHGCRCGLSHPGRGGPKNSPKEAWLPCITAYSELTFPWMTTGEILGYIPQVEQTYTYFQSAYLTSTSTNSASGKAPRANVLNYK